MHSPGVAGWILIIAVALIFFGPKKLPELGAALGRTLREFKKATNNMMEDEQPTTVSTKEPSIQLQSSEQKK